MPQNTPPPRREKWSCPHCHSSAAKPMSCVTCDRDTCEDCIGHDPEVGPVCGLCYDRKHDPEPEEE